MKLFFIFLFLTLNSLNSNASLLDKSLYMNKFSGFEVSDNDITKLENNVSSLINLNQEIIENGTSNDHQFIMKNWQTIGFVAAIGVNTKGKFGLMGFRGSAAADIYWYKKNQASNFNDISTHDKYDAFMYGTSDDAINSTISQIMSVAKASAKIKNLKLAQSNVSNKIHEFVNIVKKLKVEKDKAWYLSGLRLDLGITASGKLSPTFNLGGGVFVRIVWVPVRNKGSSETFLNENKIKDPNHKLNLLVDDISTIVDDVMDSKKIEEQGLKFQSIRIALSASASGDIFLGNASTSLALSILMNKNHKYKKPIFKKLKKLKLNSESLPTIAENGNKSSMKWKTFRKGIKKSLKLSKAFIKKNISKSKNRKWEIGFVRASFGLSANYGIGMVTVAGSPSIQLLYWR